MITVLLLLLQKKQENEHCLPTTTTRVTVIDWDEEWTRRVERRKKEKGQ